METIEVTVYIGVALIIGSMIIMFVAGISPKDIYEKIHDSFFGDRELKFKTINKEDLASNTYKVWEDCGLGATESSLTLQVESNQAQSGTINLDELFQTFLKLNMCYSIQSASRSCGSREDVDMEEIVLPAVVTIKCVPATRKLSIVKVSE
ncbi:MAG: hypothetical protein V1866_04555 [archaeon]